MDDNLPSLPGTQHETDDVPVEVGYTGNILYQLRKAREASEVCEKEEAERVREKAEQTLDVIGPIVEELDLGGHIQETIFGRGSLVRYTSLDDVPEVVKKGSSFDTWLQVKGGSVFLVQPRKFAGRFLPRFNTPQKGEIAGVMAFSFVLAMIVNGLLFTVTLPGLMTAGAISATIAFWGRKGVRRLGGAVARLMPDLFWKRVDARRALAEGGAPSLGLDGRQIANIIQGNQAQVDSILRRINLPTISDWKHGHGSEEVSMDQKDVEIAEIEGPASLTEITASPDQTKRLAAIRGTRSGENDRSWSRRLR